MGAGIQRWWRDYQTECIEHDVKVGPRTLSRYTTVNGTRVQTMRYANGRLVTVVIARGSVSYTDGIT